MHWASPPPLAEGPVSKVAWFLSESWAPARGKAGSSREDALVPDAHLHGAAAGGPGPWALVLLSSGLDQPGAHLLAAVIHSFIYYLHHSPIIYTFHTV